MLRLTTVAAAGAAAEAATRSTLRRGRSLASVAEDLPLPEFHVDEESSVGADDDDNSRPGGGPPLVRLEGARLGYPPSPSSSSADGGCPPSCWTTSPLNLSVHPPSRGGHALLGRNGSGKTLLIDALVEGSGVEPVVVAGAGESRLRGGSLNFHSSDDLLRPLRDHRGNIVAPPQPLLRHVSFSSHASLLERGGTVQRNIGGSSLNPAAQFLVVRFGLFPLLHRDVETLSTGEIRKVLLVKALSDRPRLLLLDNAFDGLDVPSRANLSDLVSRTLRGFRPDILVNGVDAKSAAHTQIVLATHRAEEVVPEVRNASWFAPGGRRGDGFATRRRGVWNGAQLMRAALLGEGANGTEREAECPHARREAEEWCSFGGGTGVWDDPCLPSEDRVAALWNTTRRGAGGGASAPPATNRPLVEARGLSVRRGDVVTLHPLDWTVGRRERWLVAGGNGAGKSTLSRLLAEGAHVSGENGEAAVPTEHGGHLRLSVHDDGVGWVSTELHMRTARSSRTARKVLLGREGASTMSPIPDEIGEEVCRWLGLLSDDNDGDDACRYSASLLSRPFCSLSQGEQKLLLLASAVARRPALLILDEPCQGLDVLSRRRALGVVQRLCEATDVCVVYITHHLEELLPAVTDVLHLAGGRAAFEGPRGEYDADAVAAAADAAAAAKKADAIEDGAEAAVR